MKTTIALVTVAVLGSAVVAHGQNPATVITIRAGEIAASGQGQGHGLTIRIGDAILSADRFQLEEAGVIRLTDNVELGVDLSRTPAFTVKVPASGGVTLRLLDMVITAGRAEPDHRSGVLRLLGDVRVRQERPSDTIRP
jgi:hypothetical protein